MSNLINEIETTLKDIEIASRHSYFQLKYFIIGKEPTNQAKMWQCLRELKSRKKSLKAIDLELEDTLDNIKIAENNAIAFENQKEITPDKEIYIRKEKRRIIALKESIEELHEKKKWIEQESKYFLETFKNLSEIEPLKHFDDLESQKEYWNKKLSEKINLKILLKNPIDTELIETILALPDDVAAKQQLIKQLNKVEKLIEKGVK